MLYEKVFVKVFNGYNSLPKILSLGVVSTLYSFFKLVIPILISDADNPVSEPVVNDESSQPTLIFGLYIAFVSLLNILIIP